MFSLSDALANSPKNLIPLIGDAGKLLVLVLLVPFFLLLVLHELNFIDVFSTLYQEEGFCVHAKVENPWLRGHAMSFYACSAMALWMQFLVYCGQQSGMSDDSLKPVKKNSISLFGHSLGHAYLAYQTNHATGGARIFEDLTFKGQMLTFAALQVVWYGFMRQRSAKRSARFAFMLALFHNSLQVFILPTRLFFTHVLLAVLASSSYRGFNREYKDKTIYYALEAWLVDVNILVMTFVESFTCETFLIHIGGHVWFDMVVPLGFTVYFGILFRQHCRENFDQTMMGFFFRKLTFQTKKKFKTALQRVKVDNSSKMFNESLNGGSVSTPHPRVAAVLTERMKLH